MKKSSKKINKLIKRKNLILEIKNFGIKRVNSEAIFLLEDYLNEDLKKLLSLLEEELKIKGKKTLEKKDIMEIVEKINEEDSFEV